MYIQAAGLLTRQVGSEVLVASENTNDFHSLNESAAIIFDRCAEGTTIDALTEEFEGLGLPDAPQAVARALQELVDAGLVVENDEAEATTAGISRRTLGKRLGLTAVGVAIVPVVEVVTARSAAAQTSAGGEIPTTTPEPRATTAAP